MCVLRSELLAQLIVSAAIAFVDAKPNAVPRNETAAEAWDHLGRLITEWKALDDQFLDAAAEAVLGAEP